MVTRGAQPADDLQVMHLTLFGCSLWPEQHPEIAREKNLEIRGHDADHRVRRAVESHAAADNRGIASEVTVPETFADDDHVRT